jgi:hypothetical protein
LVVAVSRVPITIHGLGQANPKLEVRAAQDGATDYMARPKRSLLRRILVQTDCAFWCIHDHVEAIAYLSLPTLAALVTGALALVGIWRTWDISAPVIYFIAAAPIAFVLLFIFTALPLPCAVFAWKAADGEAATARACYAWCWQKRGRLLGVFVRLGLLWLGSLLCSGLPLVWVWPRTCLAPLVALFEDERRVFRRSRRVLREEAGLSLMGFLYLGMGLVLGGLIVLPRLVLGTPMLGAHLLEASWRPMIVENLWIFETTSVAILLTAIAVNWWISLTLVYHDIRWIREGEDLKRRIALFRARLAT